MALRQLSHGVTAFRDPAMERQFRRATARSRPDHLPGRIFTTGPHIDGENPVSADWLSRDAEEARRLAEINVRQGASALKIYFRLPFSSAKAVIDVCNEHHIPCTAHLELLDAGELFAAGLHGVEHVTSLASVVPRRQAEAYRQAVLKDNEARRDGGTRSSRAWISTGPAKALYAVLRDLPWLIRHWRSSSVAPIDHPTTSPISSRRSPQDLPR
jgi:hypothetical protein